MIELFGISFKRKKEDLVSFIPATPTSEDAILADTTITSPVGGVYAAYLNLDNHAQTEAELITRYRMMTEHPEIDYAIDEIVNSVIWKNPPNKSIVNVDLTNVPELEMSSNVRKIVENEFQTILRLLKFNRYSYEIFKRWYVDGRLYYHIVTDSDKNKLCEGIKDLRYIDPRKIRRVKEVQQKRINQITIPEIVDEYYVFSDFPVGLSGSEANIMNFGSLSSPGGLKIAKDSIVFCSSGITDKDNVIILSPLHKAIKPLNQLRTLEDAQVIYTLVRAPQRRVFKIDVGNLPRAAAEQYVKEHMIKYKNKLVYDVETGEIKDDRHFLTMLEDYWLPTRGGSSGTDITALAGSKEEMVKSDQLSYFKEKLYRALNLPPSSWKDYNATNFFGITGGGAESLLQREDQKFDKFCDRLKIRFSTLFDKLLGKQLVLKNVMSIEEWESLSEYIRYEFTEDNWYLEKKQQQILVQRIATYNSIEKFVDAGVFFSRDWARKNILMQTDEEVRTQDSQIEKEKKQAAPEIPLSYNTYTSDTDKNTSKTTPATTPTTVKATDGESEELEMNDKDLNDLEG